MERRIDEEYVILQSLLGSGVSHETIYQIMLGLYGPQGRNEAHGLVSNRTRYLHRPRSLRDSMPRVTALSKDVRALKELAEALPKDATTREWLDEMATASISKDDDGKHDAGTRELERMVALELELDTHHPHNTVDWIQSRLREQPPRNFTPLRVVLPVVDDTGTKQLLIIGPNGVRRVRRAYKPNQNTRRAPPYLADQATTATYSYTGPSVVAELLEYFALSHKPKTPFWNTEHVAVTNRPLSKITSKEDVRALSRWFEAVWPRPVVEPEPLPEIEFKQLKLSMPVLHATARQGPK